MASLPFPLDFDFDISDATPETPVHLWQLNAIREQGLVPAHVNMLVQLVTHSPKIPTLYQMKETRSNFHITHEER